MGAGNLNGCLREEVAQLLSDIMATARFFDPGSTPNLITFTTSQLQALYAAESSSDSYPLSGFHIVPGESLLPALTERVRTTLAGHVLPDETFFGQEVVSNRLVPLVGGIARFSISEFTEKLILTAVVLGPERATQMLFEWVEGKPISFWQYAILDGISVEQPLELDGVIRISRLPDSPDQVFQHGPSLLRSIGYRDWQYTGRGVLSIAFEGTFPEQLQSRDGKSAVRKCLGLEAEDDPLDDFSQALALASNHYCSWMHSWYDCGDWNVFQAAASVATQRESPVHGRAILSDQHLVIARDLFAMRRSKQANAKQLDIAIDRWVNSKGRSNLTDKLIEVRIALEALYLADSGPELGFRLATRGAWHLGVDFEERRKYHQTLREVYKLASNAVHQGEVEDKAENHDVLRSAQNLCRKGILERLKEPSAPNWNDLILGKESEATP